MMLKNDGARFVILQSQFLDPTYYENIGQMI